MTFPNEPSSQKRFAPISSALLEFRFVIYGNVGREGQLLLIMDRFHSQTALLSQCYANPLYKLMEP